MSEHSAESDAGALRQFAEVYHRHHGHGVVSSLSPDRQYVVVRYPAGYLRTHRVTDLTRVTPPGVEA